MTTIDHEHHDAAVGPELGHRRISTDTLRSYSMVFALLVIWAFFQWRTVSDLYPYGLFLHPVNLANLLKQMSVTGIVAVGMLLVIVAGQIDLSVGSLLGLAGGIAAMSQGWGLLPSMVFAIVVGIAVGALQGALTSYLNIPSFIVTLGGLLGWRGVILYLSKGETIPVRLNVIRALGVALLTRSSGLVLGAIAITAVVWLNIRRERTKKRYGLPLSSTAAVAARIIIPSILVTVFVLMMNDQGGVPLPVVIMLVIALAGQFLTQHTTFGRYLYAIGSNPDAARLSGVNSRKHILLAVSLLGALVGVASLLHIGRVGSASPDAGTLMELDAIAACVIGGTSLMGGRGKVSGALLGALVMATLDTGMSLLSVENATQYIIKGAVLVAAVGFDMAGRKKS